MFDCVQEIQLRCGLRKTQLHNTRHSSMRIFYNAKLAKRLAETTLKIIKRIEPKE